MPPGFDKDIHAQIQPVNKLGEGGREKACLLTLRSLAPLHALGWIKCREHISLLVILCIIVYVTNKAHLSLNILP